MVRKSFFVAVLAAGTLLIGAAVPLIRAQTSPAPTPRQKILLDYETEAEQKPYIGSAQFQIVTDHATSGTHALKCTCSEWCNCIDITDPALLKEMGNYRTLSIDFYNPGTEFLHGFAKVIDKVSADGKESNFGTDWLFIPPGKSTLHFCLAALPRTWPHEGSNFVDQKNLTRFWVFTSADPKAPQTFYIDNIRLSDSGVELPQVEGLQAFDFGPAREAVFPGFTGVTQKSTYDAKTGFGWQGNPGQFYTATYPDVLTCDYVHDGTFVVDLKSGPGKYIVETAIDPTALYGWSNYYSTRTLKLNGKEVLNETMDGKTFLKDRYCMFENEDDTPTTDIWKDRVCRINPVRRFEADVATDGKLTVEYNGTNLMGGMCFLVVYPKAVEKQGQAYMAALDAIRKERFDATVNVAIPLPDGNAPEPTAAEKASGFIAFPRDAVGNLNCNSVPADNERNAAMTIQACPGERNAEQLGLYPLAAAKRVTVAATDLRGPGGAVIPAAAIDIQKVRHYFKREGWGTHLSLMPLVLEKFQDLQLSPGFTQPLWVAITVPAKSAPGKYQGAIHITSAGKTVDVPVNVTVNDFTLDGVDDLSISGMGTSPGNWRTWYPDLEDLWWKQADQVMALQESHGFTAITNGPNFPVKGIKDGKADIDFTDADRWLDIARQHHLTNLGDGYQGFDAIPSFGRDISANGVANNEAHAQAAYKMSYPDVIHAIYAAVSEHAKANNWPPRAYYLMDEPSGPTVEAIRQLIEQHVKAAPGVAFSGYYAPGDKANPRDAYYKTLPLSIMSSLNPEIIKTIHDAHNKVWIYVNPSYVSWMDMRRTFGKWLFIARNAGLDGITLGFNYVNTVPYFDMSDTEGSWGLVYPGPDGVNSTVWLEQISIGINDFRYLKTLAAKVAAAQKAGKTGPTLTAAQEFLDGINKGTTLADLNPARTIDTPADFASLREKSTKFIQELSKQ